MIVKRLKSYLGRLRRMQRINMCLARGAANSPLRQLDSSNPSSWEFSAFSQNGEDGIIDYLSRKIINPNRYFIEIGAESGLENNTSWLAIARRFSGLMIEGNSKASEECQTIYPYLNQGVECICQFVNRDNIEQLRHQSLFSDPDVLSVDIDGNDYYIAETLMEAGFRPKLFVVEFNSAFGPDLSSTISYNPEFPGLSAHESQIYYGVSITAWKTFFTRYGYSFVTVDQNGVNGFFVNPQEFDSEFISQLQGLDFCENFYQLRRLKCPWTEQFKMIKDLDFFEVT
ncbi:hypothetical protein [Acaryochloris sp. IP29b_bin.148]|uniref:hypothetical protein n=1 Tax=Acaryochloris sp. IP29b_bin.148 TaxID=2969218 RepID=UPI00260B3D55|nr:hypothetical protein [Acaryochloris sp. IP29b_bin.148]